MTILSRIVALEIVYKPKPKAPEWWEVQGAQNRQHARDNRELRALTEKIILSHCEGLPVEFNEKTGEIIGVPGLWRPFTIKEEDCFLRGDFGTEEQAAKDQYIIRRWRVAQGLSPKPFIIDVLKERPTPHGAHESPGVPNFERRLQQEAQRVADQYGLDVDDVLAEAEKFAEGVYRLREHLERRAAGGV